MRGQVWPDALIIIGAVVLGILVAFGSVYEVVNGSVELARKTPYVFLAEANIEQNVLRPVFLVKLYYDGNTHANALDDTNELLSKLEEMNVEVEP